MLQKQKENLSNMQEKLANENGYKDIMEFDTLKPGDKIYFVNERKKYVFSYYW